MNTDFVLAHEQLQTNINSFWGPKQPPFTYMTSKWGRESSVEVSSNSDDSYQTPPVVGLSQWDQHPEGQLSGGDGEISPLLKRQNSLSLILSQPCVPLSGGPM